MHSKSTRDLFRAVLLFGILLLTATAADAALHSISSEKAHFRYAVDHNMSELSRTALEIQSTIHTPFRSTPIITVTVKQPRRFSLLGNHPNPFNPNTTIEFELYQHGLVRLDIFNLVGQRVATLLNGPLDAGTYHIAWSGKDEDGKILASGTYVVFLQAGTQKASRSITLLK